jgi:FixJ family two-component response regulator
MCSARGRLLTILSSLQAGASHFVVKAFQQQFLLEAIQHAWNRDKPYDPDTIIALINDKRICDLEQKVSHETVNALLTLCDMPQITAEGPEFAQFWSRIRHSEQPV